VAVLQENGGAGASAAAPIARKVLDAYLLGPDGKLKPADGATQTFPVLPDQKAPDPATRAPLAPNQTTQAPRAAPPAVKPSATALPVAPQARTILPPHQKRAA
jgi:hypothetical protein